MFRLIIVLLFLTIASNSSSQAKASASASATIISSAVGINVNVDSNYSGRIIIPVITNAEALKKPYLSVKEPISQLVNIASFEIINADHQFDVTIPSIELVATKDGNPETLRLSSFTFTSHNENSTCQSRTVAIGATLHLNNNATAAQYLCDTPLTIVFNYN